MNAPKDRSLTRLALKDPELFRSQCYIDGHWVDADDKARFAVTNPADNTVMGSVPDLGAAETRRAIDAANAAWSGWRAATAKQRAQVLRRWFELVMENLDDLAVLMTAEQGKPLAEAKSEIAYAASFIEWFAEEGKRVYGDTIPPHQPDKRLIVLKQPIGVCAAITPWNFPCAMVTRKAAPALAAGCTVVLKPAEQTPYSALALAELAQRTGMPRGVFNVVTGNAATIGDELTANPVVRKLSFTGSTEVGKLLMRQCAGTVKKLSLELGGNAAFIVFDDADLDAAVEGAMASKYRNSGQTCVCANRIFVQNGVYQVFAEKLTKKVATLKVGTGFENGVQQGPLIDGQALAKVEAHVADAVARGATVLLGGKRHTLGGTFFEPTVLTEVSTDCLINHEETFGPVAALLRFGPEQEVIDLANATEYGLASYFYSNDVGRVFRVAEQLECGIVGVNTGLISNEVAPFGGFKQSGIGHEGSRYGIEEFLEIKYVCIGGI
ncbi:MAG: NADP-dependent succinate-semialdehyde dehydrogenase [Burkholderiales bacterium]